MNRFLLLLLVAVSCYAQATLEDFATVRVRDGSSSATVTGPFTWRGAWAGGTTYATGDIVKGSDGWTFISGANGNIGHDPTTDFSNTYWHLPIWWPYFGEAAGSSTVLYDLTNKWFQVTGSSTCTTGQFNDNCGFYAPNFEPRGETNGNIDYLRQWTKSGSWDAQYNRLTYQFKCSGAVTGQQGNHIAETATYIRQPNAPIDLTKQGEHYYHYLNMNVYAGKWIYVTLNRTPQHIVGGTSGVELVVDDPEFVNPHNDPANLGGTGPVHYYDGMTRFYFDPLSYAPGGGWANNTCQFTNYQLSKVSGETDAVTITDSSSHTHAIGPNSITAQYTGTRYEVTWHGAPRIVGGQKFNIRYSTSDMHVNGFTNGTDGGQVTGTNDNTDYLGGLYWNSPNIASSPTMYVAIQPNGQSLFTQVAIPPSGGGGGGGTGGSATRNIAITGAVTVK